MRVWYTCRFMVASPHRANNILLWPLIFNVLVARIHFPVFIIPVAEFHFFPFLQIEKHFALFTGLSRFRTESLQVWKFENLGNFWGILRKVKEFLRWQLPLSTLPQWCTAFLPNVIFEYKSAREHRHVGALTGISYLFDGSVDINIFFTADRFTWLYSFRCDGDYLTPRVYVLYKMFTISDYSPH